MSNPLPPFACTHSPNLPELLDDLGCTLAISTYQAGKVIFISAKDRTNLVQLPRDFDKAMGIGIKDNKIAIATKNEVIVLADSPEMAMTYPKQPKTYDALYLPRTTYYPGEVDIHDLDWVGNELWAVNTRFSCLSKIDSDFSFKPFWKPHFISDLVPEDRCHLNGMAVENDQLKYVTALGNFDKAGGWRDTKASGGIVINAENQEIIAKNLAMPHSPRLYDGELFILLSASGHLAKINRNTGELQLIKKLTGFVRGMDKLGDYLFVGLSKIREKSSSFADLPIAKESVFCGIAVIHFPTMSIVSYLKYETSVEEIYDIRVLPGKKRPGILNHKKPDHLSALVTPESTFWAKPEEENQ